MPSYKQILLIDAVKNFMRSQQHAKATHVPNLQSYVKQVFPTRKLSEICSLEEILKYMEKNIHKFIINMKNTFERSEVFRKHFFYLIQMKLFAEANICLQKFGKFVMQHFFFFQTFLFIYNIVSLIQRSLQLTCLEK